MTQLSTGPSVRSASVHARHFSVQLQLLDACNLRCSHCYIAGQGSEHIPSSREIIRRVDAVRSFCTDLGVRPAFHLSGGEPTLRQDLPRLIEYITGQRCCEVLLMTNGMRFTVHYAKQLIDSGLKYVQVSLEGPQKVHDEVRGAGTFRCAMATVESLVALGLRVTVSSTVTGHNYPYLADFVQRLDALGLHFHLREVLPIGAGADCPELTGEQRRQFYAWAINYQGCSRVGVEDPIHCSIEPGYAKTCHGCVAGRSHLCVDVDGTVYPCRPLRYPVGHVDDLQSAWESPAMIRIRSRRFEGQCGRCALREHCGGCRVHALANGNIFGEDLRCFASDLGLVYSHGEVRAIDIATRTGAAIGRIIRRNRTPTNPRG